MASAPAHVYRRRRLVALGALPAALGATRRVRAAAIGAIALVLRAAGVPPAAAPATPAAAAPKPAATPAQLPRGGRRILPDFRVVAYYGAPQDVQLGALGIGRPAHAVARLERQAKPYGRRTRPILPALALLAVVAA